MCYCGDLYCSSCGPAQGNSQCYMCGAWGLDGGCKNPDECLRAEEEYLKSQAAQYEWEKEHAHEIDALFGGSQPHE